MKFRRLALQLYRIVEDDNFRYARFLDRRGLAKVGDRTSINPHAVIMDWGRVTIGDDCSISIVQFVTHSAGDRIVELRTGEPVRNEYRISVGDRTQIGTGVLIVGNVKIGSDCMIYPGARVTKDIPDGSVVGCEPARIVGSIYEYDERQVLRQREPAARLSRARVSA